MAEKVSSITKAPAVSDVHILWITAGLSCDGDSVSVTAAEQPSIEDVLLGAIPGLPKVHLHNPVLAYENRRRIHEVLLPGGRRASWIPSCWWWKVPFPTKRSRKKATGRRWAPIPIPASRSPLANGSIAWRRRRWPLSARAPAPPTAAFTPWPGNPTGAMGLADYLGWDWRSKAGLPIVNVPGCPVQPDNFMETFCICCIRWPAWRPMIPLDEQLRPTWLFGKTVHEGCDRGGYYEQGDFATNTARPSAW